MTGTGLAGIRQLARRTRLRPIGWLVALCVLVDTSAGHAETLLGWDDDGYVALIDVGGEPGSNLLGSPRHLLADAPGIDVGEYTIRGLARHPMSGDLYALTRRTGSEEIELWRTTSGGTMAVRVGETGAGDLVGAAFTATGTLLTVLPTSDLATVDLATASIEPLGLPVTPVARLHLLRPGDDHRLLLIGAPAVGEVLIQRIDLEDASVEELLPPPEGYPFGVSLTAGFVDGRLLVQEGLRDLWEIHIRADRTTLVELAEGRLSGSRDLDPYGGVSFNVLVGFVPPDPGSSCLPTSRSLCLGGERFAVEVAFRTRNGQEGSGIGEQVSGSSGEFWFFERDNVELQVKVLDGCAINGRVWLFASASTNVEYTLTARDTLSGAFRTYRNPLGQRSPAITDTDAFAACP